jgi:hypothetical protein
MRVGGQLHAPAALPPGKRPGTHCIGGRVGPRAGLDGCEKSRPTGIRSPDRPASSESPYRLRYQKHFIHDFVSHFVTLTAEKIYGYYDNFRVGFSRLA